MYQKVRLLKIFVSCPSDVDREKNEVKRACKSLKKMYRDPKINIEVIDWKENVSPLITGKEPQTVINDQIKDYDIYVGILWKHFGKKQTNDLTPTEEEFKIALESYIKCGKPLILIYFKTDEYYPRDIFEAEQTLQVLKFKESIKTLGLFREFKTDEFFEKIMEDIDDKIYNYKLRTP